MQPRIIVIHPDHILQKNEIRELSKVRAYCSMDEDYNKVKRIVGSFAKDIERLPLVDMVEQIYPGEVKKYSLHIAALCKTYRNYNFWWLSNYSEKNGYPSEIVLENALIECLKSIENEKEFIFITSNEFFAYSLRRLLSPRPVQVMGKWRYIKSFVAKYIRLLVEIPYFVYVITKRIFYSRKWYSQRDVYRNRDAIEARLMRIFVNESRLNADGVYFDSHYGNMPQLLMQQREKWAYEPNPSSITRIRKFYSWVKHKAVDSYFLTESFWSLRDLLSAFRCGIQQVYFLHRGGIELVCRVKSFYVYQTMMNYMKSLTPQILYRLNITPKVFIFNWENKGYEKRMIEMYRRCHPQTKIIGYANSFISPVMPEAIVSAEELLQTPLPDEILCMSEYVKDVLLILGYPAQILKVGCSFRDRYIHENQSNRNSENRCVLVCTPIHEQRCLEMMGMIQGFNELSEEYSVILRLHPYSTKSTVSAAEGLTGVTVSKASIESDMQNAWAVITTGATNMICESYASGKITIKYLSDHYLNGDGLQYYSQAKIPTFSTPQQLLDILRANRDCDVMDRDKQYFFGKCDQDKVAMFN